MDLTALKRLKSLAFCLAACATVGAAIFGFSFGNGDPVKGLLFASGFGVCPIIALYILDAGLMLRRAGEVGLGNTAIAIFAFVFGVEVLAHVGLNGAQRAEGIEQAQLDRVSYADSRASIADLEAKLANIRASASWQATVDPVEAIQARIDDARAHKWWARTNECTVTKGPQTRKYCTDYRQALADKVLAEQKIGLADDEAAVRAALARLRATPVATTADAGESQGLIFASLATQSRSPSQDAQWWTLIALAVIYAGVMSLPGLLRAIANALDPVPEIVRRAAAPPVQAMRAVVTEAKAAADEAGFNFRRLVTAVLPTGPAVSGLPGGRIAASADLAGGKVGFLTAA